MTSRFTGDYGLTPNEENDLEVINLISQMGDNPSNPKPAIEAIAVWLANRWSVYNLSDLQFLWNPERTETYGAEETYNVVTYPGYFTAVSKSRGTQIPNEFAQFDDGQATYYLGFKPNEQGRPSFGLIWANPRTRGVLREIALPLLAIGSLVFDWSGTTGYAILGVGDAIAGAAVAGEIAATIGVSAAQVAQMVGSAAIGAVTSGGDIGQAIENAAAAYVGGQAGNFVAGAVDSAAAGKIAAAAVTAGARGQDVGQAILMAGAPLAAGAAAGAFNTGTTVDDYLFPTDEFAFGYDPNVDIFQNYVPSTGDVVVSFDDLGVTGPVTIDDAAAVAAGVDPNASYVADDGEVRTGSGMTVAYTAETFANGFYRDENNNIRGPDNRIIMTYQEARDVVAAGAAGCTTTGGTWKTVAGLGGVCLSPEQALGAEIQKRIASQAGQTVIPGQGSTTRPAGITPPNPNGVKMPDAVGWAAAAEAITRSVANVWSVITQVSNGTYRPGATSPYGTVRPPVPGFPVRQADGSVVVNNGNGTQTISYPNGTSKTMSTAVSGTGTFGGVSTNTLLIAGAGLAALLLLRRK
jgi:hypothetical protein